MCSSRNGRAQRRPAGEDEFQRVGGDPERGEKLAEFWHETLVDALGDGGQAAGEVGGLSVCRPACWQWRDSLPGDCAKLAERFTNIPDHVTGHGHAPRRERVE